MYQDATWYGGRLHPRGLCVRWRPSLSPKRGRSPQFSAHVYCGQTAGWIKMTLGTEVGLGPDDIVIDGDPAPLSKTGAEPPPQFSAHVHCGQAAGWIKMALGTEVGLSPLHIVLDGDPAPLSKGGRAAPIFGKFLLWPNGWMHQDATCLSPGEFVLDVDPVPLPKKGLSPPIFGPCLLWPNGCMDQDAAWYGGRRRPTRHCDRWGPSSPPLKGHRPPHFRRLSVVAKRLDRLRCHLVWR